jgi:hypothetical protein
MVEGRKDPRFVEKVFDSASLIRGATLSKSMQLRAFFLNTDT